MRVIALRGATSVDSNAPDPILGATRELVAAMIERNALGPADIVSCIFTATGDLDAEFPALAARRMGLDGVPLLCAREIDVPGAMPRVIRVLMHCYLPGEAPPQHVYLKDAAALREDLGAAQ